VGEEYRSGSSSLWRFLHSPVTSPPLAQIFSTRYSQTSLTLLFLYLCVCVCVCINPTSRKLKTAFYFMWVLNLVSHSSGIT
jgi:hypothetical protein